jgi:sigma-B regulation protein RsbU (phosphoserine phosphatase)
VGAFRDIAHATVNSSCTLHPGDVMVLYTDGVTEAMNGRREQFGMDRLCAELAQVHAAGVDEIRDHLLRAVMQWTAKQEDDVTVMVLRRQPVEAGAA